MANVKSPIAMIIFNRPDLTEILFREIARARPSKLLVIADGPRAGRAGEAKRVAETRAILDRVDWDCEVLRCFSDVNLGCKKRVSSGISWIFDQVEEAIILEDDCIPDPTFFQFCDEMLAKYRNDPKVMMVAGSSFLGDDAPKDQSYYFSHIPLIWGWATWRRAWRTYDVTAEGWPKFRGSSKYSELFAASATRRHYTRQIDRTYAGEIDTWDVQWSYCVWRQGGFCVNSAVNLIQNLGFGPGATHTHFYDAIFDPPIRPMTFPLLPPKSQTPERELDGIWQGRHYSLASKIRRRLRSYVQRAAGAFQ